MKGGELWLLWKLSPNGCAVWRAVPECPPGESSALFQSVRPSASAYCDSGPWRGSLYKPWKNTRATSKHDNYKTLIGDVLCSSPTHTLIMALEVIRKSVALSVTCLNFSPMSPLPTRSPSSSDKDLCLQSRETRGVNKKRQVNTPKTCISLVQYYSDNWYLWRADPCLTIRSLQVERSSTLLPSVCNVDWISVLRQPPPCPVAGEAAGKSSPESSVKKERVNK